MAMSLKRGDHNCSIYSSPAELTNTVTEFLADGLQRHQRCWYVATDAQADAARAGLEAKGIDVPRARRRGALKFISGDGTYVVHGSFNPEKAIAVFNDAIAQAGHDGFTGFRAAAEMSWAMGRPDTAEQLIIYEALLKSLFASCHAIGLCLYDRHRMPLNVIDGALATHPVVRTGGGYRENPFYDAAQSTLRPADEQSVLAKIEVLDRSEPRS
jgi:chemotaxis family two-component system sensor kinase Cph1